MVFSSLVFLCLFLPAFLICYFLVPKGREAVLLLFSLAFYAFGEPVWILALMFSCVSVYLSGRIIGGAETPGRKRAALIVSSALNIGILAVFKYSGFAVENINALFGADLPVPSFTLPLGISFYTFQAISYIADVYRGHIEPQRSPLKCAVYITMFPQLVAGPIVRYADIAERLNNRRVTPELFSSGVTRFAVGLAKKVLLANAAGQTASLLLDGDFPMSVLGALLGMVMFSFQIYFDFSGYSDMAIGLGRMIGFEFLENFNYPYISRAITDFWRRWHISLSAFFRDYVYIPLGGNRKRQTLNIMTVWMLTGLWHGASWNFILWGIYYGVLLLIEKYALKNVLEKIPAFLGRIYAMAVVFFGWALFYFTDMTQLFAWLRALFGFGSAAYDARALSALYSNVWLLPVLILASTPLPAKLAKWARERAGALVPLSTAALMALSFISLVGQTFNPFLYFRF